MEGLGAFIIALGIWVAYCGFKGTDAAKLGLAILSDPAKASEAISEANGEAQNRLAGLQSQGVSSGTNIGTGTNPTGDAAAVVAFARSQIGKRYVLGGKGPDVWDCSGLVMVAYEKVGVKLTHSALAQSLRGTGISRKSDLVAGDLLFPLGLGVAAIGDHVQIYTGAGTVVEAANPKVGVREIAIDHWFKGSHVYARRILANMGNANSGADYNTVGPGGREAKPPSKPQPGTAGNYYGT